MKNSIEYFKKEIEYHKLKVKEFEEYLSELNYELENDDFIITKDDIYKTIKDAKKNVVTRLFSCLYKGGCLNTKDLCQFSEGEVMRFRDLGGQSFELLKIYLTAKGKSLKEYKN